MSSIFEFPYQIRLCKNVHENLRKNFLSLFFKPFLTNRGKNKDENEKVWENKFDFRILHIKIRIRGNSHENRRKNPFFKTFLTNRSKNENENEKIWEHVFNF